MTQQPTTIRTSHHRTRWAGLRARAALRITGLRSRLADRLAPTPAPTAAAAPGAVLDAEATNWVTAHDHPVPATIAEATAVLFADAEVQTWMARTLADLGWSVTEPVLLAEGWVPARGEKTATGQPVPATFTTPSKAFARKNDPKTAKKAGAAAAANQRVTVNSHQGRLLFAYATRHAERPGAGYTAAEAVAAADLRTDGVTGSPWHRVTDLRDAGLITFLLDDTGARVARKNDSNADGQVLVITPLGLRAAAALSALAEHGYPDYPLTFDGPTDAVLFEDLPATLARIEALPAADDASGAA